MHLKLRSRPFRSIKLDAVVNKAGSHAHKSVYWRSMQRRVDLCSALAFAIVEKSPSVDAGLLLLWMDIQEHEHYCDAKLPQLLTGA
jgi:hypothetical protein